MTSTNKSLAQTLLNFSKGYYQQHIEKRGYQPIIEHDELWLSPCELEPRDDQYHYWQPVAMKNDGETGGQREELSFTNVESALNIVLHPDIKAYYTSIFSGYIDALCSEGQLTLLFAWNNEDFKLLQENIIGHILMKQRLKQPETIFFAVTDEDDIIISIDNTSGEVWVERVGCIPHKKLSDSLIDFIDQLTVTILFSE